ncbi:hypothetical protein [Streptomyces rishiriensis]|uniref:hypothetical protein n=1 Tax=Streptomyces rishiriensis TaxID=68264 RepID=UPI0037D98720
MAVDAGVGSVVAPALLLQLAVQLERITARRAELDELVRSFPLCGSELEEFWNAWGVLVGLESGQKGVDKLHAARCSDASCQEQGFGGGGRSGLGLAECVLPDGHGHVHGRRRR